MGSRRDNRKRVRKDWHDSFGTGKSRLKFDLPSKTLHGFTSPGITKHLQRDFHLTVGSPPYYGVSAATKVGSKSPTIDLVGGAQGARVWNAVRRR
jgi:hypothetical protein